MGIAAKIRVSVSKDRKEIAAIVAEVEKQGDITTAVGKAFNKARSVHSGPLWDCEIYLRMSEDSN